MNTPTTLILDGIWGYPPRWAGLRDRVRNSVGPCEIYRYENSGRTSLESAAARFANHLAALDGPFHLIGYSMGGLVARDAIRQRPDLPLVRAAFLHSPHRGSLNAWLLPFLPACREMRPGSAFLRRLNAWEWTHPTLATWTAGDLMVFPGRSACWDQATRVIRSRVPAHAWPIFGSNIHAAVVAFLRGEAPSPVAATP